MCKIHKYIYIWCWAMALFGGTFDGARLAVSPASCLCAKLLEAQIWLWNPSHYLVLEKATYFISFNTELWSFLLDEFNCSSGLTEIHFCSFLTANNVQLTQCSHHVNWWLKMGFWTSHLIYIMEYGCVSVYISRSTEGGTAADTYELTVLSPCV